MPDRTHQRPGRAEHDLVGHQLGKIRSDDAYEVRFGFTRRDALVFPVCLITIGVSGWLVREHPVIGAIALAGAAAFVLLRLISVLSRRVALRVDAAGITLAMTPPWPASKTAMVPWSDVEAVVLWDQHVRNSTVPYVGLARRPGLPPLPGSARSRLLRSMAAAVVPHVPPNVVADSRPATFYRLDRKALTAAVRRFNPTVDIIDLG